MILEVTVRVTNKKFIDTKFWGRKGDITGEEKGGRKGDITAV